jgi:SAM-dependent methyltransferase
VRRIVAGLPPGYRLLEIGCGSGLLLQGLERVCSEGYVFGMDMHPEGLRLVRKRCECPLLCGDLFEPPFSKPFDVIGAFDVIEHLSDDGEALRVLHSLLAPGGALLLTVPAHERLWSYFDEFCGHFRRYSPGGLRQAVERSGFQVEYLTEYMSLLFPLIWIGRRMAARRRPLAAVENLSPADLNVIPGINAVLEGLLALELPWIRRGRRLPFGASLLCVARRGKEDHGSARPPAGERRGRPKQTSLFPPLSDAVQVAFGPDEDLPVGNRRRTQNVILQRILGQHFELRPGPQHRR